jgi:hypothetical protein
MAAMGDKQHILDAGRAGYISSLITSELLFAVIHDIVISLDKILLVLGFIAQSTVDDGAREVVLTLRKGLIRNPQSAG